jgi:hypothetical protein
MNASKADKHPPAHSAGDMVCNIQTSFLSAAELDQLKCARGRGFRLFIPQHTVCFTAKMQQNQVQLATLVSLLAPLLMCWCFTRVSNLQVMAGQSAWAAAATGIHAAGLLLGQAWPLHQLTSG